MTVLLAPAADAAIGSKGLIIEHGTEEIVLQKGEKKFLFVQDGFSKMPIFKGLSFYSDNRLIATVGLHSGIIRANTIGTAHLTVVNSKGDCGYVRVKVVGGKRIGSFGVILFLLPILLIPICFIYKKVIPR